jgi:hypothetical protein
MSWEWSTRDSTNHLYYDQASQDTPGFPFTQLGFFKLLTKPAYTSGTALTVFCHSGNANNNNYSYIRVVDYDTVEWAAADSSYETAQGRDVNLNLNVDQWYGIAWVNTSSTSRKLYIAPVGSAFSSNTHTTDVGSVTPARHRNSIGATRRGGTPVLGNGFADGRIARVASWWGTALSDSQIQDLFDGTIEPSDIPTNLYAYWKGVNGALTDSSGNSRTLTMAGTVATSADEPFAETAKKLKILVHPAAASASGVEGIVWQRVGWHRWRRRLGEFTGKTFEADDRGQRRRGACGAARSRWRTSAAGRW